MPYGNLLADVVQSSTAGTPPQFNDGNGTQVGTLCRAWVSFAGSTGAINSSYNVSSITRGSTGNYTVNLTNALSSASYSVVVTTGIPSWQAWLINAQSKTSSTFLIQYGYGTTPTYGDPADVNVAVFR